MKPDPESDNNLFEKARASASDVRLPEPSNWIISCKLFFPLRRRYWEESRIPKVIVTDTELQGVYGYALELEKLQLRSPGVLHLSYVWEKSAGDAIAKSNEGNFARQCLQEVDEMLLRSEDIGEAISPFVDLSQAPVIHWVRKPNTPAYANLYREVSWHLSCVFRPSRFAMSSSPLML